MYGNEIFMYVDEFITNLTDITNEMLQNALELDELFPEFIHFIWGDILVGNYSQNTNF